MKRRLNAVYRGGGDEPVCSSPQCQCSPTCKNPVVKGDVFCKVHTKNQCPVKGSLSGYELDYTPQDYNKDKAIQHSHNCFAYAMGVKDYKKIEACRKKNDCKFHVPGKTKGHPEFSGKMGKTCSDVIGRTMADVPRGYVTNFQTPCNPNYSKIAVVVDKENDLHYYRQDKSGWWSHKPGGREVTDRDAYGARIYNPELASRCYPKETPDDSGLNYSSFCSYMCVPRDRPIVVAGGARNIRRTSRMAQRKSGKSRKNRRFYGGALTRKVGSRSLAAPRRPVNITNLAQPYLNMTLNYPEQMIRNRVNYDYRNNRNTRNRILQSLEESGQFD